MALSNHSCPTGEAWHQLAPSSFPERKKTQKEVRTLKTSCGGRRPLLDVFASLPNVATLSFHPLTGDTSLGFPKVSSPPSGHTSSLHEFFFFFFLIPVNRLECEILIQNLNAFGFYPSGSSNIFYSCLGQTGPK